MSVWVRYKFLIITYSILASLAFYEVFLLKVTPVNDDFAQVLLDMKVEAEMQKESPEASLKTWYRLLEEKYPEDAESQAFLGIRELSRGNFEEANKIFEDALKTGIKSNEKIFVMRILSLIQMKAPKDQILNAIREWRWNYPHSYPKELAEVFNPYLEELQKSPDKLPSR